MDLARMYLDLATIRTVKEGSKMAIPSVFAELRAESMAEAREAERQDTARSLLRLRFGDDTRIPALAERLARLDRDLYLRRITEADSLDDLL
jgi:hypothetical protein